MSGTGVMGEVMRVAGLYRVAARAFRDDADANDQRDQGFMSSARHEAITMEVNAPRYWPVADAAIIPEFDGAILDGPMNEEYLEAGRSVAMLLSREINDYQDGSDPAGMAKLADAVATLLERTLEG